MKIQFMLSLVALFVTSLSLNAQVDSMEINGEYYKIYPYPENVETHADYWTIVKDKEFFLEPENYFKSYGEDRNFTRQMFDSAGVEELEMLNKWLARRWKNMRTKDGRIGLGRRFKKQLLAHPEALIGPKYLFNKEVIPPFSPIPNGKYVQLFSEFTLADKKGKCHAQKDVVAGYFHIKNNALEGHAVWMNIAGDTIKEGDFKNGMKEGEWSMVQVTSIDRYLMSYETKSFRKTGRFAQMDTTLINAEYHNGILDGKYAYLELFSKLKINGNHNIGLESGLWETYWDKDLVKKVEYAPLDNEVLSKKPIIRTGKFLDGSIYDFNLRGYEYSRLSIPVDFYSIGFKEEPDVELEEEQFKSHELEYYGSYRNEKLPERFKEIDNFYNLYYYYDFKQDPRTELVETRGHFIDSLGAKMLYEGDYELYYPNGQLYTRYKFKDGHLVDEGIIYWDNGTIHDEITFVADSNHYVRKAYDYDGLLYRTAIYDSLGDFSKFDEAPEEIPTLEIDNIVAELQEAPVYLGGKRNVFLPGNYVYYNWETLKEEELDEQEVILYKVWSGFDTTVMGELKYNPVTKTMSDYDLSYTGFKFYEAERVFTDDFKSWNGKTIWYYGDYKVVTTSSAILKDFDNDTLPQTHLQHFYYDYDVTEDVEVFLNGELYTGKVRLHKSAPRFGLKSNKLVLNTTYNDGRYRIEKKLAKYFKKGKNADNPYLGLVNNVDACSFVGSSIHRRLFGVTKEGYFSNIDESRGEYYSRSSDVSGYILEIKGQMLEGKPQGEWIGESSGGKLLSTISFDKGNAFGEHKRYAFHDKIKKYYRESSEDSLPKKKTYFLYSTTDFANNLKNGPHTKYTWYGGIEQQGAYLDGYLDGQYLTRYSMAYSIENFKNGNLDGYLKTYLTLPYEDTILLYDLNFQHGFLNGKSVAYHTNGSLAKQGFFLDGEPIDDYEAFDTLGFKYHYVKFKYSHPVEEKIWEENELSLRYTFNWEDSIEFDPSDITSTMSLDALMYKLGYGSGSLESAYYGRPRLINKTGLAYHMTKFYPNDTIAREGRIDDGKKIGPWTFFDYEGEFLYSVNYFDSIIVVNDSVTFKSKGVLTDYDKEGNKLYDAYIIEKLEKYDCAHTDHYEIRQLYTFWEANPSTGRMNGYVRNYYDNGVLQNEGTMKDGLPDGLWKYYDPYGKLNLMGSFHQGKRHGRWLSGDLEKRKYLGEICLNPNLPDLENEKKYRENLLDITIINYYLGKALNSQFYDLDLNRYSKLQD